MKTAIVIPIYNRPDYVRRCFESLRALTVKPDMFVLVDDGSTVELPAFDGNWIRKQNGGVKSALLTGIEWAFSNGAELVINLDSDAIVKPDFVGRLVELHSRYEGEYIVSGFNNPKEKKIQSIIYKPEDHTIKRHVNGINMCFNREQYEAHIKPALLKRSGNWDYDASELAGNVAITIPSCVQHIGMVSSMGHTGADRAHDFKTLELPDVTIFGIDSHDVDGIMRAAEISFRDITFGDMNIIVDDLFTKGGNHEQRRQDYSKFMIKNLTEHFNTSHVLTIHADGYVLNADAWDNDWLQYDYIGATWWYKDNMNVGNGGFSLRSKKLCDILASYQIQHYHPEDHHICRTYRPALEKLGIRFAPEEVANKFSIEAYGTSDNKYNGQFGFHGNHVDLSMLPPDVRYNRSVKQVIQRGRIMPRRR